MSDVILYAALKENARLVEERRTGRAAVSLENYAEGALTVGGPVKAQLAGADEGDVCRPTMVQDWDETLKPFVESRANGLKVCDTSGNYRCGSGCTWTVPSGVSEVQFQLWGPGGGSSSNCCCGGAPFGPSGAYAVVKMNVNAGDVYCLCGGCAYCCCAYQNGPGICGSPTWIKGPGLCVCADSGISCYCHWGQDIGSTGLADGGCGVPRVDGCSPNSCAGWNFCWDSGNDNVCIDHSWSRQTWALNCANAACEVEAYGLNGMWPLMNMNTDLNNGSYTVSPPIFGYENMTCCSGWNGSTCHGRDMTAADGRQRGPSFGGFMDRVHGGCRACGGDPGGMGMVCVSWSVD